MSEVLEEQVTLDDLLPNVKADVRVHALWDDQLQEVLFALGGTVSNKQPGEMVNAHAIALKKNKSHRIIFSLIDHTTLKLRFRQPDPFGVAEGLDCPTGGLDCGFKMEPSASPDDQLTVINPGNKDVLTFVLRFVDQNKCNRDCDPIIKNIA